MDNTQKKRAYTKSRLVKELSFRAGISQNQSRAVLEAIIEIAYREAKANYFVLPGLCKFDVVHRNERNVRNPATGEMLILPPRDALHVTLSKRAKETVVPRVTPMKPEEYEAWKKEQVEKAAAAVPTPAPAPVPPPAPVAEAPAPVPPPAPVAEAPAPEREFVDAPEISGDQAISFKCPTCGQEVIAPMETVGYEAECPTCGTIITVPDHSEAGTSYAPGGVSNKEIITQEEAEDLTPSALKNRTIRIDAIQFDDAGNLLPRQTTGDKMAEAAKNRTMRIDLPDEF